MQAVFIFTEKLLNTFNDIFQDLCSMQTPNILFMFSVSKDNSFMRLKRPSLPIDRYTYIECSTRSIHEANICFLDHCC